MIEFALFYNVVFYGLDLNFYCKLYTHFVIRIRLYSTLFLAYIEASKSDNYLHVHTTQVSNGVSVRKMRISIL